MDLFLASLDDIGNYLSMASVMALQNLDQRGKTTQASAGARNQRSEESPTWRVHDKRYFFDLSKKQEATRSLGPDIYLPYACHGIWCRRKTALSRTRIRWFTDWMTPSKVFSIMHRENRRPIDFRIIAFDTLCMPCDPIYGGTKPFASEDWHAFVGIKFDGKGRGLDVVCCSSSSQLDSKS